MVKSVHVTTKTVGLEPNSERLILSFFTLNKNIVTKIKQRKWMHSFTFGNIHLQQLLVNNSSTKLDNGHSELNKVMHGKGF